jgi:dTDP-4-amino-4,6-dideoxygalactose transaminase
MVLCWLVERQKVRVILVRKGVMFSMHVPLVDLHAQYRTIKQEITTAFEDVLETMQLFLGPQTRAFEDEFAAYCNCRYGVGLSSGTDALTLALRACGIGSGDEVITVSNTFIATVEAVALAGALPVFVDIDPGTYTMDHRQLDAALTSRTRAILPVHLYGHPVDMQHVLDFARLHGLRVIEDASQAHGATYRGKRVGSLGDIGCFSLYYSKNLGAYGEAGICVTNNDELAETLRVLRDHGSRVRYRHELLGVNARLDEVQAAVLRVKLRYLEQWNAARQSHAMAYTRQLQDVVEAVPGAQSWGTHVYCYYVVQVPQRDHLRMRLEQEGIGTNIHYPTPIHLQPACAKYGSGRGALPVTEAVSQRILSLPMYPELTDEQIQLVINAVKKTIASKVSTV